MDNQIKEIVRNSYEKIPYFKDCKNTSSREAFEKYKDHHTHVTIPYETFKEVITKLNDFYVDYAIESGHSVALPNGMGKVCISKNKQPTILCEDGTIITKKTIDMAATRKYGKVMYHMNDNTDGYIYKINWFRNRLTSRIHAYYKFVAADHHFSRKLAKVLKDPNSDKKHLYQELRIVARIHRDLKRMLDGKGK